MIHFQAVVGILFMIIGAIDIEDTGIDYSLKKHVKKILCLKIPNQQQTN